MREQQYDSESFVQIDFTKQRIALNTYDTCTFERCDFSKSDLAEVRFLDCRFIGCNFTLCSVGNTVFGNAVFQECKMTGINFEKANTALFSASFIQCDLSSSLFTKIKLRKTQFDNCILKSVDFTGCDLTDAKLPASDLAGAHFENTILEKADLRTAFNYSIDPDINRIRKARFSQSGLHGLLEKYGIEVS